MPTISVNGFEMHYQVRGNGEPLLLLHGGMGIGDDWRHVFPSDPSGYRVIVPDLRGHGRSTNPGGAFTFRQCAQDVLALLDGLGVKRIKAIGLSMGAKTLLHMGTVQPARIDEMVIVSATPRFPDALRSLPHSSPRRHSTDCRTKIATRCVDVTSTETTRSARFTR
jgi:pimeloyl-ACP methyl ester carboxylesterase